MITRTSIPSLAMIFFSLSTPSTWSATTTREETRGEDRLLVLENEHARIVVFPAAGAAITEYIDKRTGINFVAGTVAKGKVSYGWKDVTRLHPNDPGKEWFGARPYQAQFKNETGFKSIVATCEADGIRVEREMRLADVNAELTVLVKHSNVAATPRGVWLRWQPYMVLDDVYAEHSAILTPGPGPHQMRRIPVGSGWDHNFMAVPGYWLAANYQTGNGLWMTFRKEQVVDCSTWTDANFSKHAKRAWFAPELFPKPVLLPPGASTELHCTYLPFTGQDEPGKLSMGFVAEADQTAARRFLKLVKANMAVPGQHTMVPEPNNSGAAEKDNCFFFQHKRRDRFAFLDWGIVDAMMTVAAVQSEPSRLRLFARMFDSHKSAAKVRFQLSVRDSLGKQVAEQAWQDNIDPSKQRTIDRRESFPLKDLPDGWYTFTLEAFADDSKEPVHRYVERRKLVGNRRAQLAAARLAEKAAPERPFVTALRRVELTGPRVPIGVEEAGGLARTNWPVRVGVPFAKGKVMKTTAVRMTSPDGKTVPTQTHVMGTWPDGSVKWLLADFQANVPANGHVFYQLETTDGKATAGSPILTQQANRIMVDTGTAKHEFSAAKDGKLLGLFSPDDLWWETGEGHRFQLRIEGDGAGIVIEENGPLRGVVKATGWYFETAKSGARPIAMGELRAEFYRNQRFYRLYHTVTYAGDPWQDTLGSYGIRFQFTDKPARQVAIELDGKLHTRPDKLSLRQADEDVALLTSGDKPIMTGHRASGAAELSRQDGTVVVYHRDLWKLHPKKIEADAATGSLTFHYWPKEAGAMDWRPREDGWLPNSTDMGGLAVGASRTHEFVIDEAADAPLLDVPKRFDEPVLAVVPPRYLCATDALLHLQPYDPDRVPELERQVIETFDSYLLNQDLYGWYGEWAYGAMPNIYLEKEQRWADYGRYGYILNEQDICHVPWLAFLRSGDRKYFKFAEANTRHLMEAATIRLDPVCPDFVGMSRRHHECVWLGQGDYGHSMLDPFLELYHVTGYKPAWEAAERMARGMAEQRSDLYQWRYLSNPIAGLSRMYLETQVPFYKEQADRIWRDLCSPDRNEWWRIDHGNRMVLYYSQLNDDCRRLWNEWTDTKEDRFQGLDVLAAQYRRTGDIKYAQAVLKAFRGQQQSGSSHDPERKDPIRWSIPSPTQGVLANLREMLYASQAVADAEKHGKPGN